MAAQLAIGLAYLGRLDEAAELRAGVAQLEDRGGGLPGDGGVANRAARRGESPASRARGGQSQAARHPAAGFLRGEIAATQGRDAEAVEALQRYRGVPNVGIWQSWMQPRALYLLARSHLRLGQRDRAVPYLHQLARQRQGADHDAPLHGEIGTLAVELGTSPRVP